MNFTDITTDAEYLLDVGMGPETHPQHWRNTGICHGNTDYPMVRDNTYIDSGNRAWILHFGQDLGIGVTDPARKWELLANVLQVIGPELDRRGWTFNLVMGYWVKIYQLPPTGDPDCQHMLIGPLATSDTLLEAYHAAVKAGRLKHE